MSGAVRRSATAQATLFLDSTAAGRCATIVARAACLPHEAGKVRVLWDAEGAGMIPHSYAADSNKVRAFANALLVACAAADELAAQRTRPRVPAAPDQPCVM